MTPWVQWERIVVSKGLGGWGLKNIFLFAKSLVAKGGWRLLKTESLWTRVMFQKYISPVFVEDWIQNPVKTHTGVQLFGRLWLSRLMQLNIVLHGMWGMEGN